MPATAFMAILTPSSCPPPTRENRRSTRPTTAALLDRMGGHMHPLNYTLGLAGPGARPAFGSSSIRPRPPCRKRASVRVSTAPGGGGARAPRHPRRRRLVGGPRPQGRTTDHARGQLCRRHRPAGRRREPDPERRGGVRHAVRGQLLSPDPDGRMLFGGGERYTPDPPPTSPTFVRPHMEATFPRCAGVAIDHAWGGLVSITRTRLPHVGRSGRGAVRPRLFRHGRHPVHSRPASCWPRR